MKKQGKKKYKRHLSIRLALGITLILILVQIVSLVVNGVGLFISGLAENMSPVIESSRFIEENVKWEAYEQSIREGEKTEAVNDEENFLQGYIYAMGSRISHLIFFSEDEAGYYVLSDIAEDDSTTFAYGDRLDNIALGDLEFIKEIDKTESEKKEDKVADALKLDNETELKQAAEKIFGNLKISEIVYPGVVSGEMTSGDIMYLMIIDPLGFFEGMALSFAVLLGVTLVSTLLIMIILSLWINHRVASPLKKIKNAAAGFIEQTKTSKDPEEWNYEAPKIKTRDEIQALSDSVEDMAHEISDSVRQLVSDAQERQRVGTELQLAAGIQNSMLPSTFPAFPDRKDFDIYASMDPAREVGGDFYDFFLIDDTHLFMTIADVSGKGIPASLFMMMSKLIISSLAKEGLSPAEILEMANNPIADMNERDMFVTSWIGILDLSTGILRAANAGHEYPAIKKGDEGFSLLKDKHGFVIGELKNIRHHEYEIALNPGDIVFVYTDGVPEANNENQEMFGNERMLSALNNTGDQSPQAYLENVTESIREFTGQAEQFDDVTMLCVKYLGIPEGSAEAENSCLEPKELSRN